MAEYVILYLNSDVDSICETVMSASEDPVEGTGHKDVSEMNESYKWMKDN